MMLIKSEKKFIRFSLKHFVARNLYFCIIIEHAKVITLLITCALKYLGALLPRLIKYRFDIILDSKGKPILLEVNHTPSFTTDTPLDDAVKFGVIHDTLKLMNISINNRIRYKNN